MNSNTTRTTASLKKGGQEEKTAFGKKEPMIDRMSPDDFQRSLHNEYDLGCVSPQNLPRTYCGNENFERLFDHHLF
jgi:hypothetical protein